jgi:hypothetical protein
VAHADESTRAAVEVVLAARQLSPPDEFKELDDTFGAMLGQGAGLCLP